jgi:carboxymethylenebutenolidase
MGGADKSIPPAMAEGFAAKVREQGVSVDLHLYEGAPHSFFDRASGEWADACQDAWRHVLALTDRVAAG